MDAWKAPFVVFVVLFIIGLYVLTFDSVNSLWAVPWWLAASVFGLVSLNYSVNADVIEKHKQKEKQKKKQEEYMIKYTNCINDFMFLYEQAPKDVGVSWLHLKEVLHTKGHEFEHIRNAYRALRQAGMLERNRMNITFKHEIDHNDILSLLNNDKTS